MMRMRATIEKASAPFPKFVIHCSTLCHELRKQRGTSKPMILVPLFDLKFLIEFAATGVGTSNRRHYRRAEARDQPVDAVRHAPPIVQPGAWKAHRHVSAADAPLVQA